MNNKLIIGVLLVGIIAIINLAFNMFVLGYNVAHKHEIKAYMTDNGTKFICECGKEMHITLE